MKHPNVISKGFKGLTTHVGTILGSQASDELAKGEFWWECAAANHNIEGMWVGG
jgi:hypothetical protein